MIIISKYVKEAWKTKQFYKKACFPLRFKGIRKIKSKFVFCLFRFFLKMKIYSWVYSLLTYNFKIYSVHNFKKQNLPTIFQNICLQEAWTFIHDLLHTPGMYNDSLWNNTSFKLTSHMTWISSRYMKTSQTDYLYIYRSGSNNFSGYIMFHILAIFLSQSPEVFQHLDPPL